MANAYLEQLSREQLMELIEIYAKNWLAMDGVWFQAVEQAHGMDTAMAHDITAWQRFTVIEARRIKAFLGLGEHPGLDGLEQALHYRFYGNLNDHRCERVGDRLIYRNIDCRVQTARLRKGMPLHPCKAAAVYEYEGFARTIDDRIACKCLSCYPDCAPDDCGCAWEFWVEEPAAH